MSIYRYSGNSTIAEARFHTAPNRAPVALLGAAEHADPAALVQLRQAMAARGWQCTPVFDEGREQLQVSGFQDIPDVTAMLVAHQAVAGDPEIRVEERDLAGRTRQDWLNRSKMKIAGWLNALGDLTLFAAGIDAKDKFMTLAGGLYTGGALTLGLYGSVKTDRQLKDATQDLAAFMQQKAGALPADSGLSATLGQAPRGALHKVESYLYRHPADIMLGAYTAGAASMLGSGIVNKNKSRIGYGIWSMLVKTVSFLMPEKKKVEGEPETATPRKAGGLIEWLKERPLRLFGYGSLITELLQTSAAWKDLKNPEKRRSGILGLITAGAYILSDIFMATSSKDPTNADGKFSDDQQRQLAGMAAEAIISAPREQQVQLAGEVGSFLAKRPEMRGSKDTIAKAILEQAAHLGKNRWAARAVHEEATPATQAIR